MKHYNEMTAIPYKYVSVLSMHVWLGMPTELHLIIFVYHNLLIVSLYVIKHLIFLIYFYRQSIRSSMLAGVAFGFSQGLLFFAYAACYYLGAHLIDEGKIDFGDMMK